VNGLTYDRAGDDVLDGLYVELGPWGTHVLSVAVGNPSPEEDLP
jgi:hypothetical protein